MEISDNRLSIKDITLVLFAALVAGSIPLFRGTDILGIFLSLSLFIVFMVLSTSFIKDKKLVTILYLSLVLKLILSFVNLYVFPLPASSNDAVYFNTKGIEYANYFSGISDTFPAALSGTSLFTQIIGLVYTAFGNVPMAPQLIVVLLSVCSTIFVYGIAKNVTGDLKVARLAALITAIFPTLNLYSAVLLRESLVVFFTTLSFYLFIKWWNNKKIHLFLLSVASLLVASTTHTGVIFIAVAYVALAAFYNPKTNRWAFWQIRKIFIVSSIFLVAFLLFGEQITSKLPSTENLSAGLLSNHLQNYAYDRAAYLVGFLPTNMIDVFYQTPIRMIYFLFTPFPNMISTVGDLIGFTDALFYFILSVFSLYGLRELRRTNKAYFWLFLLALIISLFIFSWGTSNYGAAIRHRQKISFLLIILASIGFYSRRIRLKKKTKKVSAG